MSYKSVLSSSYNVKFPSQVLIVHLLSTPRVLAKLRTELKAAIPDISVPLSVKDIEQLPYLGAVITEGLRLGIGNARRQTRISPSDVMIFNDGRKEWHIPPGVSITPLIPKCHTGTF